MYRSLNPCPLTGSRTSPARRKADFLLPRQAGHTTRLRTESARVSLRAFLRLSPQLKMRGAARPADRSAMRLPQLGAASIWPTVSTPRERSSWQPRSGFSALQRGHFCSRLLLALARMLQIRHAQNTPSILGEKATSEQGARYTQYAVASQAGIEGYVFMRMCHSRKRIVARIYHCWLRKEVVAIFGVVF